MTLIDTNLYFTLFFFFHLYELSLKTFHKSAALFLPVKSHLHTGENIINLR